MATAPCHAMLSVPYMRMPAMSACGACASKLVMHACAHVEQPLHQAYTHTTEKRITRPSKLCNAAPDRMAGWSNCSRVENSNTQRSKQDKDSWGT